MMAIYGQNILFCVFDYPPTHQYLKYFVCLSLNTKNYHQYLFSQFIIIKKVQNVGTNIFEHRHSCPHHHHQPINKHFPSQNTADYYYIITTSFVLTDMIINSCVLSDILYSYILDNHVISGSLSTRHGASSGC